MNKLFYRLIFLILAVLFTAEVVAQVPQGFNFQAVARNADGDLIANSELGVRVSVLQGSETGTAVYTEIQTPTTSAVGSFQIVIGEGTSEDNFSSIDWSSDNYYVKLEIDPAGGTEYEELGTTRLLSVPYALLAQNVVSIDDEYTDFIEINTDDPTLQDSLTIIRTGSETEQEFAYAVNVIGFSTGRNRPLVGQIRESAENTASQYAVNGRADGPGSGTHIGMLGSAYNLDASAGGTRYGVYGQAASKSKYNYGVNGYATGTGNGDEGTGVGEGSINFGVFGFASGNTWNNTGLEAQSSGDSGKWNFGVHGLSFSGTGTEVENHGVAGRASGPGINYGVYGAAWDGVENYAGYFDGETVINGTLTVNGDINHTGSITQTSDRNLKENIQPLQSGLATIMKLNPATYNFRGNGEYNGLKLSTGLHYGLIAQEVEEVLPSLVQNNIHRYSEIVSNDQGPDATSETEMKKTMEYKTMNYTELIPVLIKGMQEQQGLIEKQQQKIDRLLKEVEALKKEK
ncbi:tail fiber domain-containing protein [Gracilimonas sp.]|uniref:tail fiber domain-containing protein n=1 Tax=Gracilimonas sp. TaxID=1974203 RepID=UPI003BA9F47D